MEPDAKSARADGPPVQACLSCRLASSAQPEIRAIIYAAHSLGEFITMISHVIGMSPVPAAPYGHNWRRAAVAGIAAAILATVVPAPKPAAATQPNWVASAEGYPRIVELRADAAGRIIVGGAFWSEAIFGKGERNETHLTSDGYGGAFFAAYQPNGLLRWAVQDTAAFFSFLTGMDDDPAGNVFGTGTVYGGACFAAAVGGEHCVESSGCCNGVFFVRLAADGRAQWLRTPFASDYDTGWADPGDIAADRQGRAVAVGTYAGPIVFGVGEPGETRLTGDGIFIVQFTADGSVRWVRDALGRFEGARIATDAFGNAVIAGSFSGTVRFAPGKPEAVTLTSVGAGDGFIAKYNTDGRLLWARRWGNTGHNGVQELAIDPSGRIYVLGSAADGRRVVLVRYGANGGFQFRKTLSGIATATSIAIGADGRLHVTGNFTGRAVFGAGQPTAKALTAVGASDIFVAGYGPDGRFQSVAQIANPAGGIGNGVAVDRAARVVVAGNAESPLRFDGGAPVSTWGSAFVARYGARHAAGEADPDLPE